MGARRSRSDSVDRPLTEAEEAAAIWRAWRLADIEAGLALQRWSAASKGGKARAYDSYRDALELEARAADALAELLGRHARAGAREAVAAT
jgi:hypothetical protein